MRTSIFLLLCGVVVSVFATATTNKVVFIDENNQINAPEVIASVADMTSNKTEIAIAQAAATAAMNAAREGTNLINATVEDIASKELVVYRHGVTDSLGVVVALPEGTKCVVQSFSPNVAIDGSGNTQHELIYATSEDAGAVEPQIKYSRTVDGGREAFTVLDMTVDWSRLSGSYEMLDGSVFNYRYSVKFWRPVDTQGFYIVYLDGDAADGDGMTFDIRNGITGGLTETVTNGTQRLVFKGGLLMRIATNDDE